MRGQCGAHSVSSTKSMAAVTCEKCRQIMEHHHGAINMTALIITYVIGTSSVNDAEFPGNSLEALKTEIEETIRAAFPAAQHVDVVLENGDSEVRAAGLNDDELGEEGERIEAECVRLGDEVWNHGQWHYAE